MKNAKHELVCPSSGKGVESALQSKIKRISHVSKCFCTLAKVPVATNWHHSSGKNIKHEIMEGNNITVDKKSADSKLMELFLEQLEELYWSEKKLIKALDKMQQAASSNELKENFRRQQEGTHAQIARLKGIFETLDQKPDKAKSHAMSGIINEIHDCIDHEDTSDYKKDAALIIEAQKAKHFEIALYGALAQLAETMGCTEVKTILGQTLQEEKQADTLLSLIATSGINQKASTESSAVVHS
jgi:ferritin-like metal-binding protein YciE